MTEQNEIITLVFKNKASDFKKNAFTAGRAVKINVNEVELTIFKGTNSILASDIAKVVIRYAR
ncbi:hypothetical protein CBF86_10075 [Limosilactobacillus reuteri]|uniref:Uncharacterized protein n=1 Tax=Limosilactobacillus reuteri TaxID=1598 RepID=A0A256SJ51_LIMRT|nr:hypothetical protein [Limosilactobacillus reuteri]MCR1863353.1 hypothetical protein [Limosilactobacillus reuteri]MCR1893790.1 hypothetical protein [Limosilactobacillus reuteri]OYS45704.1 hypothetical protein CBF86_10075 [Limosilactobacillus reuteri]OYS46524.1 hypothetical protein CBF84_10275 [Limosilactobacillus reuteri]OYS51793.1 hypothetical protein CBF95_11090 [Limosilactobacillus reuteri]